MARKKNICHVELEKDVFFSQDFQKNIGRLTQGATDYLYKKGLFVVEFSTAEQTSIFLDKMKSWNDKR